MAGLGTSLLDSLLEKIVGDGKEEYFYHVEMIDSYRIGLARKHRQSMVEKRQVAHIANLLNSSDPDDIIVGLMGEAQIRTAPSLNRTLSTLSSTVSVQTKLTRSDTQASTSSAPSTVPSSPISPRDPSVSSKPPGYVRQIRDRKPIFYSVRDTWGRLPVPDSSSTTVAPPRTHGKNCAYHKTAWSGFGPNPPVDFPVNPAEMAGEGCYRISGQASGEELIRSFKERIYPLGPLISSLVGDVEIRGLGFTYDHLMLEIYHRTSARKHRNPDVPFYKITRSKGGLQVQHGFPCQPRLLAESGSRIPGHRRSEWYAQDPTAREFNFIHFRLPPVASNTLDAKYIGVPRPNKPQFARTRADSSVTEAKADEQRVEYPGQVRFADEPEILGETSIVHHFNSTKQNQSSHITGTPPLDIVNAATQTDTMACGKIRTGGHITKLGTAPHQARDTPSLLSKEHPLFSRSMQRAAPEPRLEPNQRKLTDLQEMDEDMDDDFGPWEDICVEKNIDICDEPCKAEKFKPQIKSKRDIPPKMTHTLSSGRHPARNKSQQYIEARALAVARNEALAQARDKAEAQRQAQGHAPPRYQGPVRPPTDSVVRDQAYKPPQNFFSVQAGKELQEQVKAPIPPNAMAHIQKHVQGQIEALFKAQVNCAPPGQLGDEVRNRVQAQFRAHIPQVVHQQHLPHPVTVQGFHRSVTMIRIPTAEEDTSEDALESCS